MNFALVRTLLRMSSLGASVLVVGCGGKVEPSDEVPQDMQSCSLITSLFVDPSAAPVGASIKVAAVADDPHPVYTWSSNGGMFVDPHAATTQFSCTNPGVVQITLVVTDGDCIDTAPGSFSCE